ncbi:MAG: antibiotic biosynthesis monooxygenase [Dehalococcoidales bacterium]
MFALVVRLKAIKGEEEAIRSLMRETAEKVRRNEKETLIYDMHYKVGDSTEIVLYERYRDKNAWEAIHMSQPYIKELLAELPKHIEGQPQIEEYEVVESL